MLTKQVTINNKQTRNVLNFKPINGMSMNHYQRLISYINELVRDKAERTDDGWSLSFNDLTDDEQGELIVLQLEEDDRDTYDCFHQADQYAKDDEITCALIKLLRDNNPDTREDFAEAVRKQSIARYQNKLQELIDDSCGWERMNNSQGFID